MTLFDTAGMERFTVTIPPTYFRYAKVILLVYSIDNADSISDMPVWIGNYSINRLGDSIADAITIMLGNKADLEENRDVTIDRAKETARICGIPEENIFEISTRTGKGFDEFFDHLALLLSKSESRWKERKKTIRAHAPEENAPKKQTNCLSCSKH